MSNNKRITSRSFEYKTKIMRRAPDNNDTLDTEVVAPLKYLSIFWRFLNLPLINCETGLDLSWPKKFIIFEISITPRILANPNANPPVHEVAAIHKNCCIISNK